MFLPCRDSNLPWKIGFHLTMEWLVSWPLKNNLMAGKILILRRHLYLVFWDHWDHFLSMSQENVFQITNPPVLLTVRYWKLPFSSLISLLKMLIFRSLCEFTRGYPMNHIYIYTYCRSLPHRPSHFVWLCTTRKAMTPPCLRDMICETTRSVNSWWFQGEFNGEFSDFYGS